MFLRLLFVFSLIVAPATAMAAESPDEVVGQLVSSFANLNLVSYDNVLGDEFLFLFSPEDVVIYGSFLDRAAELAAIQALFSGQVTSPSPPLQSITFDLTPLGDWVTRAGPIPTQIRSYAAAITVRWVDSSVFVIESQQEFAALDVGEFAVDFRLIGWTEFGPLEKAGVATTWGAFKMGGPGTVALNRDSVSRLKSRY